MLDKRSNVASADYLDKNHVGMRLSCCTPTFSRTLVLFLAQHVSSNEGRASQRSSVLLPPLRA